MKKLILSLCTFLLMLGLTNCNNDKYIAPATAVTTSDTDAATKQKHWEILQTLLKEKGAGNARLAAAAAAAGIVFPPNGVTLSASITANSCARFTANARVASPATLEFKKNGTALTFDATWYMLGGRDGLEFPQMRKQTGIKKITNIDGAIRGWSATADEDWWFVIFFDIKDGSKVVSYSSLLFPGGDGLVADFNSLPFCR